MRIDKSLEALARTLKDLRDNQNIFGGAIILSSCDFRNRSNVPHELNACLKLSVCKETSINDYDASVFVSRPNCDCVFEAVAGYWKW